MAEPFRTFTSRLGVLGAADIDTDQIIPARFLSTTERAGLGRHLFADLRAPGDIAAFLESDGDFGVLVAGENFGCGSSREHAAWALADRGVRAVIAPSFADIFRGNALENGLLTVTLGTDAHRELCGRHGTPVTVDLERGQVRAEGLPPFPFTTEPFARKRLLEGIDSLDFLLSHRDAIQAYENELR